jgi:hypothetical protein
LCHDEEPAAVLMCGVSTVGRCVSTNYEFGFAFGDNFGVSFSI